MVIRGGVYWINLGTRRPCVVVSSVDVLSVNVWQSHVVPVTPNVARASTAGSLPQVVVDDIDDGIRAILGLCPDIDRLRRRAKELLQWARTGGPCSSRRSTLSAPPPIVRVFP